MKKNTREEYILKASEKASYKSGLITAEKNPHDLIMLLTALRRFRHNDRLLFRLIIASIFLTLLLGIGIHIAIPDTYLQYWAYELCAFFLVVEIFRGGFNRPPRSFDTVISLCQILSCDVGKNTPVLLKMDLRSSVEKTKLVSESSSDIPRGTCLTLIYSDPWLALETQLEDKTKLAVSVLDHIRVKKLSRRNPRGKFKTKWRRKNKTVITVNVKRKPLDQGISSEWVTKTGFLYSEGDKVKDPMNRIVELIMVSLKGSIAGRNVALGPQ